MDLFGHESALDSDVVPLAERVRPSNIDEVLGQEHLLGRSGILRRLIEADRVPSMILFGPPGSGKTSIAEVIAKRTSARTVRINAVSEGIRAIRQAASEAASSLHLRGTKTLLFVDEVHRFGRAQQDALLPHLERGTLTLVGSTTENPGISLSAPLLSRVQLFELRVLDDQSLARVLQRGLAEENERAQSKIPYTLSDAALTQIRAMAEGDARVALNDLEAAISVASARGHTEITTEDVTESCERTLTRHSATGDDHYDMASAFIKSIRGSDPDGAVYWLARMIEAGEDPRFIARRIMISAAEDIGLADPEALSVAVAASDVLERVGLPEARIALAEAVLYLACAPKSNSALLAVDAAMDAVRCGGDAEVPAHLRGSGYPGAARLGRGRGYLYPHDFPEGKVEQEYLPVKIRGARFYRRNERDRSNG